MRKRRVKASLIFLVTAISLSVMTACDKDNKADDKNKEADDKKVENAADTEQFVSERDGIGGKLNVPEGCDIELDVGNTGMKSIRVCDDEISVPDIDKMSIVYIKPYEMDAGQKQYLMEAVYDRGKDIYKYDEDHMTKADYENELEHQKQMRDSGQDIKKGIIEELEEKIQTASDEYEPAGDYSVNGYLGEIAGIKFETMIIGDDEQGIAGKDYSLYIRKYADASSYLLDERPVENARSAYVSGTNEMLERDFVNESEMTSQEAEQIADDFIAGFDKFNYIKAGTYDLVWNYYMYDESDWTKTTYGCDGYSITYRNAVDGVPVYMLRGSQEIDNLQNMGGYIDMPGGWNLIYVYDERIIGGYIDVSLQEYDKDSNVELLSYEEIIKKANTEIPAYYEKYPCSFKSIEFNDLRLSYYIVPDGNGLYKYIPVWIFLEYDELSGNDESEMPLQIVMLNAMDGTYIDLLENAKAAGRFNEY